MRLPIPSCIDKNTLGHPHPLQVLKIRDLRFPYPAFLATLTCINLNQSIHEEGRPQIYGFEEVIPAQSLFDLDKRV